MAAYTTNEHTYSSFKAAVLSSEDPTHEMKRQFGENGHAELTATGLGDSLLAFFDKLVRELGDDEPRIREYIRQVLMEARSSKDVELVKNLLFLFSKLVGVEEERVKSVFLTRCSRSFTKSTL